VDDATSNSTLTFHQALDPTSAQTVVQTQSVGTSHFARSIVTVVLRDTSNVAVINAHMLNDESSPPGGKCALSGSAVPTT
jgi:hypothetical protein